MDNDKVGRYLLQTSPYHVDVNGNISIGVLGNHLLNVAGLHSEEHGFGMSVLQPLQCTWVLSRLCIELYRSPLQHESFWIETWGESVYKLFSNRGYAIKDASGTSIGYAKSVWAVLHTESRKPINLLTINEGKMIGCMTTHSCPIEPPNRNNLRGEFLRTHEYKTVFSDIDINGHVNSIKYIEHTLDLFPMEMLKTHRLKRYDIAYVTESYYGETLFFHLYQVNHLEYMVEVKRNNEQVAVRSTLIFEPLAVE